MRQFETPAIDCYLSADLVVRGRRNFVQGTRATLVGITKFLEKLDMTIKTIPDGYSTVTPYLVVSDVNEFIDFLKKTLNASVVMNMPGPDGKPMHAEVQIGDSKVMMGQCCGEYPSFPAMLYIYLDDVDATYKRALDNGATSMREPADQFYGDRTCMVKDKYGNAWCFATHKEDVSEKEMKQRSQEYAGAKS